MHSGCEAWLMLVQLPSHVVAMEADTNPERGGALLDPQNAPVRKMWLPSMLACLNRLVCLQKGTLCIVSKWNWALSHHIGSNITYLLLNLQKSGNSWTSILTRAGLDPCACHMEPPLCL